MVLVHYLNVPLMDENKLTLPSLSHCIEKKEWGKDELVCQLRPMFASATHNHGSSPAEKLDMVQQTEQTIQSIVGQLMESQAKFHRECGCTGAAICEKANCKNKHCIISPKGGATDATNSTTTTPSLIHNHNRLVTLIQNQKAASVTAQQALAARQNVPTTTGLVINSGNQVATTRPLTTNTPLILNLSQLQGSNGLIILSSQSATPISIINGTPSATAADGSTNNTHTSSTQQASHSMEHALQTTVTATNPTQTAHIVNRQSLATQIQSHLETQNRIQNQGQITNQIRSQGQGQLGSQLGHAQMSQGSILEVSNKNIDNNTITIRPIKQENGETDKAFPRSDRTIQSQPASEMPLSSGTQGETGSPGSSSDNKMEVSGYSDSSPNKTPTLDDMVNELNMKNEIQTFHDPSLHMTPEEIQKTLSANLPGGARIGQGEMTNHNTGSLESIEAMRTSMVSPQSADLNFDAFDSLLDLPDFENDNLVSDSGTSQTTSVTTAMTSSAAIVTTTASASTAGCCSCPANQRPAQMENSERKQDSRAGIANITDFSPDWSFPEGGVKVLVTGPWYSTTSPYTIMFDRISVPATLVQSGVLRCFCPAHGPGLVTLQVACEGYIISNSCVFEYKGRQVASEADKQREWFTVREDQMKMAVLEKLEEIEKRLAPGHSHLGLSSKTKLGQSRDTFESRLLEYVSQLMHRSWSKGNYLIRASPMRLTLLHLVAALGYAKLIQALVRWRTLSPSLVLEYEVDALSIDDRACTPLMWACARGKLEAVAILYQWNTSAVSVCNKMGALSTTVARTHGYPHIAEMLEKLELMRMSSQRLPSVVTLPSAPGTRSPAQSFFMPPSPQVAAPPMQTENSMIVDPSVMSKGVLPPVSATVPRELLEDDSMPPNVTLSANNQLPFLTPAVPPLRDEQAATLDGSRHDQQGLALDGSRHDQQGLALDGSRHDQQGLPLDGSRHDQQGLTLDGLKIDIPPYSNESLLEVVYTSSAHSTPGASFFEDTSAQSKHARLLKRSSVEVLPGYVENIVTDSSSKCSKTDDLNASTKVQDEGHAEMLGQGQLEVRSHGGLRTVNSDPYLAAMVNLMTSEDNPMLSVHERDLNSPIMYMDTQYTNQQGLTLEDIQRETVAMETDTPRSSSPYITIEKLASVEEEKSPHSVFDGAYEQNQMMMTLVNQIIAAMPDRIKMSPSRSEDMDDTYISHQMELQRERSSSHSSFSSYSSAATPPCADDSGISTPLEGIAYEEYRYPDLGTPASSLSPASSCLQSPYSFTLDSPPPTTAEFYEYFNAPTVFMEKDFSQLTLSDVEQRRLYEAAKLIQSFYRQYKGKKSAAAQKQHAQRQKEIEAAILIQSYYRRYKQYTYYKKMTQAAVLIQSQFRSYYAQKRFKRSREAATVIQNQYRTYKEHERFKKSRNAAVIIQQRFRSHYQRKRNEQEMARKMQQAIAQSGSSTEVEKDPVTGDTASRSTEEITAVKDSGRKCQTTSSSNTTVDSASHSTNAKVSPQQDGKAISQSIQERSFKMQYQQKRKSSIPLTREEIDSPPGGSTDRMPGGSTDKMIGGSTDRMIGGSTDKNHLHSADKS